MLDADRKLANKYPHTYALYLSCLEDIAPFVDKNKLVYEQLKYTDYDFGISFDEYLTIAQKHDYIGRYTPQQISIMLYWLNRSPLIEEIDAKEKTSNFINAYKHATGDDISVLTVLNADER